MIKRIEITNFKGIGKTVTIPVKPITLLFGANSSGKSSILQCLMMLLQSLSESGLEEPRLLSKGAKVDLGDWKNFIHKHDPDREFSVKFSMDLSAEAIEFFREHLPNLSNGNASHTNLTQEFLCLMESLDTFKPCDSIGIEYIFRNPQLHANFKMALFLGQSKKPVFTYTHFQIEKNQPDSKCWKYNTEHEYWLSYAKTLKKIKSDSLQILQSSLFQEDYTTDNAIKFCENLHTKFSRLFNRFDGFLPVDFCLHKPSDFVSGSQMITDHTIGFSPALFLTLLSQHVRQFLTGLDYIGSLREPPKRYYLKNDPESSEVMALNDSNLLKIVNNEFKYLKTGYQLDIATMKNNAYEIDDVFVLRFIEDRTGCKASVKNVGFGFSQVLPVVMHSILPFSDEKSTVVIEQPELHLHPAMQAELGDLFIRGINIKHQNGASKVFILETHSEHLILRLLRRVRETVEEELPDNVPPISPDTIAVLYVQSGKKGTEITHIPLSNDGGFSKPWPQGFFPERVKELF